MLCCAVLCVSVSVCVVFVSPLTSRVSNFSSASTQSAAQAAELAATKVAAAEERANAARLEAMAAASRELDALSAQLADMRREAEALRLRSDEAARREAAALREAESSREALRDATTRSKAELAAREAEIQVALKAQAESADVASRTRAEAERRLAEAKALHQEAVKMLDTATQGCVLRCRRLGVRGVRPGLTSSCGRRYRSASEVRERVTSYEQELEQERRRAASIERQLVKIGGVDAALPALTDGTPAYIAAAGDSANGDVPPPPPAYGQPVKWGSPVPQGAQDGRKDVIIQAAREHEAELQKQIKRLEVQVRRREREAKDSHNKYARIRNALVHARGDDQALALVAEDDAAQQQQKGLVLDKPPTRRDAHGRLVVRNQPGGKEGQKALARLAALGKVKATSPQTRQVQTYSYGLGTVASPSALQLSYQTRARSAPTAHLEMRKKRRAHAAPRYSHRPVGTPGSALPLSPGSALPLTPASSTPGSSPRGGLERSPSRMELLLVSQKEAREASSPHATARATLRKQVLTHKREQRQREKEREAVRGAHVRERREKGLSNMAKAYENARARSKQRVAGRDRSASNASSLSPRASPSSKLVKSADDKVALEKLLATQYPKAEPYGLRAMLYSDDEDEAAKGAEDDVAKTAETLLAESKQKMSVLQAALKASRDAEQASVKQVMLIMKQGVAVANGGSLQDAVQDGGISTGESGDDDEEDDSSSEYGSSDEEEEDSSDVTDSDDEYDSADDSDYIPDSDDESGSEYTDESDDDDDDDDESSDEDDE